tara:strand:+ start:3943 stop:4554 length:612 start_codon:yes stop_codon:yes gene_type:complete
MKTLVSVFPFLLLAGCGPDGEAQQAFKPNSCEAVNAVLAAGEESPPYASLRGEPKMLGDRPLDDAWMANSNAFGSSCDVNLMDGFFGSDISTYSCELFTASGSLDKESREAEARKMTDSVRDTLQTCLGPEWVMEEDTENSDFEIYQKYVFEPASGRPGADTFDFTVDPIYIEMSYTPFMRGRGGPSGWIAEIQFQQQREEQN